MGVEVLEPVFQARPSKTVILNLEYSQNSLAQYDSLFGLNVTRHSSLHRQNYKCYQDLVKRITKLTQNRLKALDGVLTLKKRGYHESQKSKFYSVDQSPREKREIATGIALSLAITSLVTSLSSAIYFQTTYNSLYKYISDINEQVQANIALDRLLKENILILKNETDTVAVRSNEILTNLRALKQINACTLKTVYANEILTEISQKLGATLKDINEHRLSTNIIGIDFLTHLYDNTNIFDGTVLKVDPTLIYTLAKISLLNVNLESLSVSILLAIPTLSVEPHYFKVNLTPLPISAVRNNVPITITPKLDVSEFLLPTDTVEAPGFSLKNLNDSVLDSARVPSDCTTVSGRTYCKNFFRAPTALKRCLSELTHGKTVPNHCDVRVTNGSNDLNVQQAVRGTLISASSDVVVTGLSGKLKTVLHHYNPRGDSFCLYVPNHFSQIVLEHGTEKTIVNQTNQFISSLFYLSTATTYVEEEKKVYFQKLVHEFDLVDGLTNLTSTNLVQMLWKKINIRVPGYLIDLGQIVSWAALVLALGITVTLYQWTHMRWRCPWRGRAANAPRAPSFRWRSRPAGAPDVEVESG